MKRCYKCKNNKKDSEFYKDRSKKDGLTQGCKSCMIKYKKEYQVTKKGFLTKALNSAKHRAKNKNVPFDLDFKHIESIATEKCPIFNVNMLYYACFNGSGNPEKTTASLDRIVPELGYVKGNVVFISHWANTIKSNATEIELYAVADWLHDARKKVLNAQTITTTSIPAGHYSKSEEHSKHGTILATGTGEDNDDTYHHCGTISRQDLDHRAQTSSGDGVAHRNKKVEPSSAFTRGEDHGQPSAEGSSSEVRGRPLFD